MTDNTDKLRVENETLRNENCDLSMRLECAETELEDVLDRLNDEKRSRTRLTEEINALRREVGELKEKNETPRTFGALPQYRAGREPRRRGW